MVWLQILPQHPSLGEMLLSCYCCASSFSVALYICSLVLVLYLASQPSGFSDLLVDVLRGGNPYSYIGVSFMSVASSISDYVVEVDLLSSYLADITALSASSDRCFK